MISFRLISALFIILLADDSYGQSEALYTCFYDSQTSTMTMTLRKEIEPGIAEGLVGIDIADLAQSRNCRSVNDTVDTVTYLTISITTDMSKVQTNPANDCYVVDDGGTVVRYYILQESKYKMIIFDDKFYNFTCDSSIASGVAATIDAQDVSILIGLLDENTLNPSNVSLTARLMDSSSRTEVTGAAVLNQQVYIEYNYSRNEADPGIPLSFQVTRLEVSGDSSFSEPTIIMLDTNGCPDFSNTAFNISRGVKVESRSLIDADTTVSYNGETGNFVISAFTDSNQLFFRTFWQADCFSTDEDRCFDAGLHCDSLVVGRRRRQAEEEQISGTFEFSVDISLFGNTNTGDYETSVPLIEPKEVCSDEKSFWIVSIVLGVLLIVVLSFAVILFYKLRKEQGNKTVDNKLFGVKNPSI